MKKVKLSNPHAGFKMNHKFDAKKAENFLFENHKFINCKFYGVDFAKLNISQASFKKCLFEECNFSNITLGDEVMQDNMLHLKYDDCIFNGGNFENTIFKNIWLSECSFHGCEKFLTIELDEAIIDDTCIVEYDSEDEEAIWEMKYGIEKTL